MRAFFERIKQSQKVAAIYKDCEDQKSHSSNAFMRQNFKIRDVIDQLALGLKFKNN